MEYLLARSGLDHVSRLIFRCLDVQSLVFCRCVGKMWREFIDKEKFYWQLVLIELVTKPKKFRCVQLGCKNTIVLEKSLLGRRDLRYEIICHFQKHIAFEDLKYVVTFLRKYYVQISDFDYKYFNLSPLAYAVSHNEIRYLKLLSETEHFSEECQMDLKYHWRFHGHELLQMACLMGNSEVIEFLLTNVEQIDLNRRDVDTRMTPLHVVCKYGRLEALKSLIKWSEFIDFNSVTFGLQIWKRRNCTTFIGNK